MKSYLKGTLVRLCTAVTVGGALTIMSQPANALQVQHTTGFNVTSLHAIATPGQPLVSQFSDIAQIIPKFDSSLGTLTGVNIGLSSSYLFTARAETEGQQSTVLVSGTGQVDPEFGFDVGGSFVSIASTSAIRGASCSDSRFIRVRSCDDSENAFESFVTDAQLAPAFFASFLDTSAATPMARFQQTLTASLDSCIGECEFTLEGYVWSGSFTVTYDYEQSVAQVPAPGAFALLGLGLVGLRMTRRKRAA